MVIVAALLAGTATLPADLHDRRQFAATRFEGLPRDYHSSFQEALEKADASGTYADLYSGISYGRRDVQTVLAGYSLEELAVLCNRKVEKVGEHTWRFYPDNSLVEQQAVAA